MIRIDHLNLQLPSGYEHRAHSIVKLIATELAHYPVEQHIHHKHISLKTIHIEQGCSDKHVAASVANQIHHHVTAMTEKHHG